MDSSSSFSATPLERILQFLSGIGIPVRERPLAEATFVPGILMEHGALVIDRPKLAYPGDLLHEAGHIAVVPANDRATLHESVPTGPAEEMAAIAWSYAAALHIGIDPAVVFHPDGYKGGAASLLEAFTSGRALGVPLLQWYGLTRERADDSGAAVYPQMTRWLRGENETS